MTDTAKTISRISIAGGLLLAAVLTFVFLYPADADADSQTDATATESSEGDEQEAPAAIPVEATTVEQGRIAAYLSATANLVPESSVSVLAEWEGRVATLAVEEGDRVAAGSILAKLAREDGEIALSKARIRADTQRHVFERARELRQQELLSAEAFDKTVLEHEVAQQELAEAEWRLEKTVIRAPFAGRVTQRTTQLGQHVRPGDELFTIADFDPLVARIYLPEKDVLSLTEGRAVRIALRADDGVTFDGKIRQISPVVDTTTGTVKVTVEARHLPTSVRPGSFVRIDIERQSVAAATLVPREAVIRELKKTYAFVANGDKAEKRTLELGLEEGDNVQVISGLTPGEWVIVAGQGGLEDGSPIKRMTGGGETVATLQIASR